MIIRGDMMREFLIVMILGTTLGLFISLPTYPPTVNIWEGNTSGRLENHQERKEK